MISLDAVRAKIETDDLLSSIDPRRIYDRQKFECKVKSPRDKQDKAQKQEDMETDLLVPDDVEREKCSNKPILRKFF